MIIDELLDRLAHVRRAGRGWMARCPSHADHNPSLSVHEGERGLLVRCWAGCSLTEICDALGMTTAQLFYDADGPVDRAAIRRQLLQRQAERTRKRRNGRRADALREGEAVIRAATGTDISAWTDEQFDAAMSCVCDARELLEREDTDATQYERDSA